MENTFSVSKDEEKRVDAEPMRLLGAVLTVLFLPRGSSERVRAHDAVSREIPHIQPPQDIAANLLGRRS